MNVYKTIFLLVLLFAGVLLVVYSYSSPLDNTNEKMMNQIRIDDGILPDSQHNLTDEDVLITIKTSRSFKKLLLLCLL